MGEMELEMIIEKGTIQLIIQCSSHSVSSL